MSGFDWILETSCLLILSEAFDSNSPSRPSVCKRFDARKSIEKASLCMRQHPMALTLHVEEDLLEGTDSEESLALTFTESARQSWDEQFQDDGFQGELAVRCADALVGMLLDNPRVLGSSGSRTALVDRVTVAMTRAFEFLGVRGCRVVGFVGSEDPSNPAKATDGRLVFSAVDELLRTSDSAGFILERVMGCELRSLLSQHLGELATMSKSEVCWGLAALVEQLEIPSPSSMAIPVLAWARASRVRRMLAEWIQEFGLNRTLQDDDTMLSVYYEMILLYDNPVSKPKISAAIWLLESEVDPYAACPNPVYACKAHALIASRLAEGVLLAFESWNDWNISRRSPSPEAPAAAPEGLAAATELASASAVLSQGPVLRLPAIYGKPSELHQNWVRWKLRQQGQDYGGNATYILDRRPAIYRRAALPSASSL